MPDPTRLTVRFEVALTYAAWAHAGHLRKGTTIPYISHPLAVAALVMESGGDEDEIIAALLHDTAEDAGGEGRLADIRVRFGERVADIVDGCSDAYGQAGSGVEKPDWLVRKKNAPGAPGARHALRPSGLGGGQAAQRPRRPWRLQDHGGATLVSLQRRTRGDIVVLPEGDGPLDRAFPLTLDRGPEAHGGRARGAGPSRRDPSA